MKGRRVLALEDTSTTGNSVLTAVDALEADGAEVVGVAVLVDRGARQKVLDRGLPYIAVYELEELGSLVPGYRRTRSPGFSPERVVPAARSLRNSRSR